MKKLLVRSLVLIVLILLSFLLPTTNSELKTAYAQNCITTTSRADGLVTSPGVGNTSKFGTSSGACVVNSKAAFTPYKIPTYEDLKSIYYTQAKATAGITKHLIPKGNKTEGDIPMTGATDHIYAIEKTSEAALDGDLTIDGNISGNQTGIVFIDGNLIIKKNLPSGNPAISPTSGIVFIVKGDVNILSSVTRIDAVIISSGKICTASSNGTTCPVGNTIIISPLIINGSLISIYKNSQTADACNNIDPTNPSCPVLKFKRELADNRTASEQINHQIKYLIILRHIFSETIQKWSEIDANFIIPTLAPNAIIYWKAPRQGIANMTVTHRQAWATDGNGFTIYVGYANSVGGWPGTNVQSSSVAGNDNNIKTFNVTKQMTGNGDALFYGMYSNGNVFHDDSLYTVSVSFTPN